MKKYIFAAIFVFAITHLSYAETLYLKSGQKVKVEILQKTDHNIKVNQNGRLRTYYMSQIERIEADIVDAEVLEGIDVDQFTFTRESKVERILKLMEINGTREVLETNIDKIIDRAPLEQKEEMIEIFDLNGLMEELIPIFDEYYTEQEIQELIDFYESPIGQKVINQTPDIMKDVMDKTVNYLLERAKK